MKADANVDESAVSREHQVVIGRDGLITIAGGKLTTYRRMAAEVVDMAVKLLRLGNRLPKNLRPARTDEEPLPGAVGWPEDDEYRQVLRYIVEASDRRLSTQTAEFLAGMYGMCAVDVARIVASDPSAASPIVEGRMEIMAQVDWAVSSEFACEVDDVMTRRTQIFFRDADQGLSAVSRVGARMAEQLGWDDQRRASSEEGYRKAVADGRAWRND
jgi:glycerol-3-phosphate dehydrogenase